MSGATIRAGGCFLTTAKCMWNMIFRRTEIMCSGCVGTARRGRRRGRGGARGGGGGGGGGAPQASATGKPTLGMVLIEAEGPVDMTLDRMPEQFQKVFVTLPSATVTKEAAAKQILSTFATRAFRRPVADA